MFIESKRLILREWRDDDVNALVDGLNNINVAKWLAAVPYPYTTRDAESFIYYAKNIAPNAGNTMLAIVLKENGEVIGGTSIEAVSKRNGTATGGIWLNEKYHHNGYGIEAFSAKIEYCFETLGLRRIENGYFPENTASRNMQHKLGFKDEGVRRKKYFCLSTREYVDECITGLLKEEFIEID